MNPVFAQQSVKSSPVTTSVGSPAPLASSGGPTNSGDFVYYCQKDSRWSGTGYACETVAAAGCGPTSFAMVLSTFGINTNPAQAAKIMTDGSFNTCGQGSRMEAMLQNKSFLNKISLDPGPPLRTGNIIDLQLAKEYIDKGYLIIGSSDRFPICNCGHIFVVQDVNPANNTVFIRDPANCPDGKGVERDINRTYQVSSFIWKYAYPVKKL